MYDDRQPRTQVIVDDYNDAQEMEVRLSFHEAAAVLRAEDASVDLSKASDVEPWVRIRSERYISCGVTVIPDEEDQA